jgi:large repetitive protein
VYGPGGQDIATLAVRAVQPPDAPRAVLDVDGDTTGRAPFTVTFVNRSEGQISNYLWDFGDGQQSDSSQERVVHEFTAPGTYNVQLTVANETGGDTVEQTINVLTPLVEPNALFTASPLSGPAPLLVEFNNQSSGDNLTFLWDFGTGETSNDPGPLITHEFTQSGIYTVQLTATNADENLSDTHEITIEVGDEVVVVEPLEVSFIARPDPMTPLGFILEGSATGGTGEYTYSWDFGIEGAASGSGQTTSVIYPGAGTYTITLTVDDGENTASVQQQVIPLSASFVATIAPDNSLMVLLSASASGGTGQYTYTWNFGDTNLPEGSGQATSVTYNQAGTYTVTLAVRDGVSAPVTVQQSVIVSEPEPEATATGLPSPTATDAPPSTATDVPPPPTATDAPPADTATPAPEPIIASFDVQRDPSNPNAVGVQAFASGGTGEYTFTWNFGAEGVADATGPVTQVTYPNPGTFTITLAVTDSAGQSTSAQQQVTIDAPTPTPVPLEPVTASFDVQRDPGNPNAVGVQAFASGGTGEYTFTWNFGAEGVADATGPVTQVTYPNPGTFTITLAVTDSAGQSTSAQQQVTIDAPTPTPVPLEPVTASFDVQRDPGNPNVVGVQAFASGGSGEYTFTWNFGAEGVADATGPVTQVTYPNPGTFTITLAVTDSAGQSISAQQQVTIDAPTPTPVPLEPVTASFDVQRDPGNPNVVGVQAFASGGSGEYTFTWNFGAEGVADATGPVTQVTYPNPGTFTITLAVTDSAGQSTSAQQQVTIDAPTPTPAPEPLQASFMAIPDPNTPRMYILEATASGGTGPYTYAWNFGAEGVPEATGEVTSVTYPQVGTFTITLVVSDNAGQSTSVQQTVTPVSASFNVNVAPDDPQTLFLEAAASGGTGNYSYNWNFGLEGVSDGAGQTTSVTYPMSGTFTIRLTVIDGVAAPVRVEQQVSVEARAEPTPTVPAQIAENLAANEPILPDLNELDNDIRPVIQASGRPVNAFSVMGDRTIATDRYLEPFGTGNYVIGDPSLNYLEDVISNFGATNSFTQQRYAVDQNMTVRDLLAPATSGECNAEESRLRCELRLNQPSIVLLGIGYNDVQQMTDPSAFTADLTQVVREILNQNAVPVLLTIYPTTDPAYQAQIVDINNAIIRVANDEQGQIGRQIPLYNQWRSLDGLPDRGLLNGEPSVDSQGAGYLSPGVNTGENVRNLETLILLYEMWMQFGQ